MARAVVSAVARATEQLATVIRSLPLGPSRSSSPMPTYNIGKIQGDIERLSRTLVRIRARLNDAEKLEITDESVRLWLRELEGVFCAAEDVLEEMLYEAPDPREKGATVLLVGEIAIQVSDPGSSPAPGVAAFLHDVQRRIEEINSRFDEISVDRVALQLNASAGWKRVEAEIPARQPTTSLMEEPLIFGRDRDLETVKKFLLSNDESSSRSRNLTLMAIVGMGGLGKTTLAQLAYNDGEVCKQFDLKSWVCVSEDFDLVRLTRAMIESFTGEACHLSELDTLQIKLKGKLDGKCFLLVLDDVWEQEGLVHIWDRLRAPLRLCGSGGSKIVITTRSEEVSRIAGAVSTHHLPCLEYEDCLQLFNQRAFEGRDPAALHPDLMAMAKEITKKCGGVPLVAKILGAQLRWVDDEQKWKDILEGDIWDTDKTGIMPVLKLSYDLLPAHLRKCFRYCSLFPKNNRFDKDKLVRMWMAHDYIQPKGGRLLEDIGGDYFDELLCRSFFQSSLSAKMFWMHDLIHDLARYVSREDCCSLEDNKPRSELEGYVRHFSVIYSKHRKDIIGHIQLPGNLRSFVFICSLQGRANSMEPLNDVLSVTKYLRVLDLYDSGLTYLPNSIGGLKLLRFLGLPKYLLRSSIVQLPDSISKLRNLRHLICDYDVVYPAGIGNLSNLETMPGFNSSEKYGGAKLGELKDINNIRSLYISGLDCSTDVETAKKACLEKKEHLRELHFTWGGRSPFDEEVLENLKPNPSLESLRIDNFSGQSFPSWLGHPSFSKLASVELTRCYSASLPSLGHLLSLKYLSIGSMYKVECIGCEFFLGGFPRLETLRLVSMYYLKSCCGVQRGECPRLKDLSIYDCRRLASLSLICQLSPPLQKLWIYQCPLLRDWCQHHNHELIHIPTLSIEGMDNGHVVLKNVGDVPEATKSSLMALDRLRTLKLEWDGDSSHVSSEYAEPEEVLENLRPHSNLAELVIQGYAGLSFATWLGDPSFSKLICITLSECSQCKLLPPLGCLPHLKQLYIRGAHRLEHIGNEFFGDCSIHNGGRSRCAFPSLRDLEFHDLPIWEDWQSGDGDLPSLDKLTIRHCPNIGSLPCLTQLKVLELGASEKLMFPTTLVNISSLQCLQIADLPGLSQLPIIPNHLVALILKNLTTLPYLVIPHSVRNLTLEGCNEEAIVASLPCLTNLTSLRISQLPELTQAIPLHNLVALRELEISNCPKLETVDCFYFSPSSETHVDGLQALESLRRLSLTDCPKLHFSASERPPSTLRYLNLNCCPLLIPWCDRDLRRLKHIHEIWVDGVQISTANGESIRSQIEQEQKGCDGLYNRQRRRHQL